MLASRTGTKQRLAISPCTVQTNGDVKVDTSRKFEATLNPTSYTHDRSIKYDKTKAQGQLAPETRFDAVGAEKVAFELVIDGTGVVSLPIPGKKPDDVKTQIEALGEIVYEYDGERHQPNVVRLLWGSLSFIGRLESMSIDYNLFKPDGEPLRARVKLGFVEYMSKEEEALRANRSSPDLSHRVRFRAGDTLPLLCHRIYRDSSYYLEVARFNGLDDFRNIPPGTEIDFPPLAHS